MSNLWSSVQRRWPEQPVLSWLAIVAIIAGAVGPMLYMMPTGQKASLRTGTVTFVAEAPNPKSGSEARVIHVRTPAGENFVVRLPNGASCAVGQSVGIYRVPAVLGTLTTIAPEGCRDSPAAFNP